MKKLLLLIPVGLLATSGLLWINYGQQTTPKETTQIVQPVPEDSVQLFTLYEHSIRQIVRYGDDKSIALVQTYANALNSKLHTYSKSGINTQSIQEILTQYQQDNRNLTQKASLFTQKMHTYSQFEQTNEKKFLTSLEQIGLYELKSTLASLDKTRLDYIKEPSLETQEKYELLSKKMKTIVSDLYLDESIEKPLFAYIDNHNLYFKTVATIYTDTGLETINRLHKSSYAIKAQLGLLPTS
jgi:methionine synthase II (cobalamin-independent)